MPKVTTFLMFEGAAEAAITFYTSLLPNSEIVAINRYGADGPGQPGTVYHATFTLSGQTFQAIDSHVKHAFTFTPSTSIHVLCDTDDQIRELFHRLADGGQVLMPLDQYPWGKSGWVNDRFGVSWQMGLAQV